MFRLARKPSLTLGLLLRVLFVIVAVAALFLVQRRTYMIALAAIITIGAIIDLIYFAMRTRHGAPVVEIDRQSLAYGDSAQVRVVGAQSVKLVGECDVVSAVDISKYRDKKIVRSRCYEEELFHGSADMRLQLPKSPPADGMTWAIVVDSEHSYPLRVLTGSGLKS